MTGALSTTSAVITTCPCVVISPITLSVSVPIMALGTEMTVVMPPLLLVTPVIVIPIIMDFVGRVLAESIGNFLVMHRCPWPIVVGGSIPGISTGDVVVAPHIEKIMGYSHRNIKPESRWRDKFGWTRDHHGLRCIDRCHRGPDIDTDTEPDI